MADRISADELWQFSLALYPKVKSACLSLQDKHGANVNLLLLLCLLEERQLSLAREQLCQLSTTLQRFSVQFTQPLRALRKQSCTAMLTTAQQQQLKQSLLQTELQVRQSLATNTASLVLDRHAGGAVASGRAGALHAGAGTAAGAGSAPASWCRSRTATG